MLKKPQADVSVPIVLVAAVAANGIIGNENGLPWRLPSDLKRFKAVTMGKPVLMGRKTFETIGKPLSGRLNIVVSRRPGFAHAGVVVAASLERAIETAKARLAGASEICIIGGGELYRQAMPLASRLYITHVMAKPEGDTLFPPIDATQWEPVAVEELPASENDSAAMAFTVYERRIAA